MRIGMIFLALALAGCSQSGDQAQTTGGAGASAAPSEPVTASEGGAEAIPCALAGAETYNQTCPVERATVEGKLQLVVRHPDGGFRRFEVVGDGRGVVVADGAEEARSVPGNGALEVFVGEDAYRFPAKARSDAKAK